MRYLAVDLGDKRTGLAIGDSLTRIVTPLEVLEIDIQAGGGELLFDAIVKSLHDQVGTGACELVVGLPLNMDGSEGKRAKGVRAFGAKLSQKTGRTLHYQDERLTSVEADWSMARSGMTRGEKKSRRDALAAAVLLRDFVKGLPGSGTTDSASDSPMDPPTDVTRESPSQQPPPGASGVSNWSRKSD